MTEFTCRSGGSNLNAGTLDGVNEATTAPLVTYASGTYDATTRVFTPASGNPVSDGVIAGTHWVGVSDGLASLRTTGVANSNATTPDNAAFDVTDLDVRVRVRLDDWTPSTSNRLVCRWLAAGNRSWHFGVTSSGFLSLTTSNNGTTTTFTINSTVATSFTDGSVGWIRVTYDVDNGAGQNEAKFYTSTDGSTWTQLGATVTNAGTTSLFAGASTIFVGIDQDQAGGVVGNVYSVEVRDGIGGTIVANPDFSAQSPGATSFSDTAGSPNTWTVGSAASIVAATSAQLIALVSARDATTITLDATRRSGGATSGTATLIVGGAWRGPNGTDQFPLNHVSTAVVSPRINLKNDQTYSITATITVFQAGPGIIQGYTSTFGDQGRCTLDGGSPVGTSFRMLYITGSNWQVWDCVVQNNGTGGTSAGFFLLGAGTVLGRSKATGIRFQGVASSNNTLYLRDVEVTGCNTANVAIGAVDFTACGAVLERCYIHDNTAASSSACGVLFGSSSDWSAMFDCIIESNGSDGIRMTSNGGAVYLHNCDFYANGGDGIDITGTSSASRLVAENCNFVANGGYGINASGAGQRTGRIINCGFGSGTAANTSGTVNSLKGIDEISNVTYASGVTPWRDPANGDFTVTLAAAKNGGRGTLPGTTATSTPVIGAAQSPSGGSGGGVGRVLRTGG